MSDLGPDQAGADLARWVAGGDRAALDRAVAIAADLAYDQALRLLGRSSDAEDAAQEALVQLIRSAPRYDPARPFRPWLARIVHDACAHLLRAGSRRRRHEAAAGPPATDPAGAGRPEIDLEAVRAAVLALPAALRAAVEMHYFAGLSQAEAATSLGISENACAARMSRARERLRVLLARRGVQAPVAVILPLLAATPSSGAPPGLAAGICAQAAAGTLPATTLPSSLLPIGLHTMICSPLVMTCLLLGLIAAVGIPFASSGGGRPPEAVAQAPEPPAPRCEVAADELALLMGVSSFLVRIPEGERAFYGLAVVSRDGMRAGGYAAFAPGELVKVLYWYDGDTLRSALIAQGPERRSALASGLPLPGLRKRPLQRPSPRSDRVYAVGELVAVWSERQPDEGDGQRTPLRADSLGLLLVREGAPSDWRFQAPPATPPTAPREPPPEREAAEAKPGF